MTSKKRTLVHFFGVPIPWRIALLILLAVTSFFVVKYWLNYGKWRTFDSSDAYLGDIDHPYFRIDYPANWNIGTHGGRLRIWHDVWASFDTSLFGFPAEKWVWLYWQPMEKPTTDKVLEWGQELIDQRGREGYAVSGLEDVVVGTEDYEASTQSYLSPYGFTVQLVYIIGEHEAFCLEFASRTRGFDEKTKRQFEHMLATFEMIERPESVSLPVSEPSQRP